MDLERKLAEIKGDSPQAKLAEAGIAWSQAYRALYGAVKLPGATQTASKKAGIAQESSPTRLQPIQFNIEIPFVSEKVYTETRQAVETAIPGVFIAPIRPVSMAELLIEDLQRPQRRFNHDWVNSSETMRATTPPEMEVFVDPKNFKIEGSNNLSTDAQKARIAEEAVKVNLLLPEAVRPHVGWHMVDPSTLSQLEDRYIGENNGALLLPDFFGRTDVQTVQGCVAHVGRYDSSYRREVGGWHRDLGYRNVFGVLVGVLPQKLTA